MIFNTSISIGSMFENPQAVLILQESIPGFDRIIANEQAKALSVEQLIRYTRLPGGDQLIAAINEKLNSLNTAENAISASERALMVEFFKIDEEEKKRKFEKVTHKQDSICPGKDWLDTNGRKIQAHGGAVYYESGTYYWYGENKEYTDAKNGIWTWGLKIYSSKDLYNWDYLGYLIPPILDNPNSSFFPTKRVDRPHILKCRKKGKYVCWVKLSGPEASFTIWQADSITGPYEMVREYYNPGGHKVGDFDLVCDDETGEAFVYFDADHRSMLCMQLSDDYLKAEKEICSSYSSLTPPFTREAPALFEKDGVKYMFTSGMTGYVPNRSDSACSSDWDKEFVSLGNPHVDDSSDASFNSQISKVFKVEGTDQYIAMADRWVSYTLLDARLSDIFTRVVASNYNPDKYSATAEEKVEMASVDNLERVNTSLATYVWLPVEWEDGRPVLRWKDEWKIEHA